LVVSQDWKERCSPIGLARCKKTPIVLVHHLDLSRLRRRGCNGVFPRSGAVVAECGLSFSLAAKCAAWHKYSLTSGASLRVARPESSKGVPSLAHALRGLRACL